MWRSRLLRAAGPTQSQTTHGQLDSLRCWALFAALGMSAVIASQLLPGTAAAQSLRTAASAISVPTGPVASVPVSIVKPPFKIRSYEGGAEYQPGQGLALDGKCLDYGTPPATPAPFPIGAGAGGATGVPVSVALVQNVSTVATATAAIATAATTPPTVFLNDCSQAHSIVVEELNNGRHEVILHAGSQVIGIVQSTGISQPLLATTGGSTAAVTPAGTYQLQLYTPPVVTSPTATGPSETVNDVFALDGDSIILASSRCADVTACSRPPTQLVVQLQNGRSDTGTPLVVAPRNLADSEFWDFLATDNSGAYPTSGFWAASNATELLNVMGQINQIAQQNAGAAWGNVIVVKNAGNCVDGAGVQVNDWNGNPIPQCINLNDSPAYIDASGPHNMEIPTGVTIRGDRRGTNLGPLLLGQYHPEGDPWLDTYMMHTGGSYVRITGLRLEGPTGSTAPWVSPDGKQYAYVEGILIDSPAIEVIVDHNELFNWQNGTIRVHGGPGSYSETCVNGQPGVLDPNTGFFFPAAPASLDSAHVERNFIHDNAVESSGYGVNVTNGGGATILGNTFLYNRHAIAGNQSVATQQYAALNNLVLSDAPSYGGNYEQDFDMHGTGDTPRDGYGQWAGYYVEIAWNTFLGGNRENLELRGLPCHEPDLFQNNVSQHAEDGAINQWDYSGNPTGGEITITGKEWSVANPANFLGVGDFNGDSVQDVFLATGATWFTSHGGVAEWRYLSGEHTGNMRNLLLGDFDGDGRTDVVMINGSSLIVSWGGISDWQVLNTLPAGATIADLAVGDFNGDGRADILYTTGTYWYISSGGSGPFNYVNSSSFRVPSLRFGHFSICGSDRETDVFGIVSDKWQVTCGALGNWQPLPVSLTTSLSNLYIADFDGDGNADIAQFYSTSYEGNYFTSLTWRFSYGATQGWISHTILPTSSCPAFGSPELGTPVDPGLVVAGIGSFDANPGADLLLWGTNSTGSKLCVVSGGIGDAQVQSRQEMR